jgi:hypothetical protein
MAHYKTLIETKKFNTRVIYKLPPKTKQKKRFISTSNLPRTKAKGL